MAMNCEDVYANICEFLHEIAAVRACPTLYMDCCWCGNEFVFCSLVSPIHSVVNQPVYATYSVLHLCLIMLPMTIGSFSSFMAKEIHEQPESVMNTMRGRVNFDANLVVLGGLKDYICEIRRCRRLLFIACGTSYHAAVAVIVGLLMSVLNIPR